MEVIPPTGANITQKQDLPLPYLKQGSRQQARWLPTPGEATIARMNIDDIHREVVQMATMCPAPETPYNRDLLLSESAALAKPSVKPPHLEEVRYQEACPAEEKPHWRDEREKSEEPEETPQERANAELEEAKRLNHFLEGRLWSSPEPEPLVKQDLHGNYFVEKEKRFPPRAYEPEGDVLRVVFLD